MNLQVNSWMKIAAAMMSSSGVAGWSPTGLWRRPGIVALTIGLAVLLQRAWLWVLYGPSISRTVSENPDWLTWQFLPLSAYIDHFDAALLYLQQTPPLPHLLLGIIVKLLAWPIHVAEALIFIQSLISAITSSLSFLLLQRIGCSILISTLVALWFGFSTDLYLLEINSFGQIFYETGAMLLCTATALCLCADQGAIEAVPSASRSLLAGLFTGLAVLTRASCSYLGLPVLLVIAVRAGRRATFLFLIPLLVLQGGWSLKTAVVHAHLSPAMSSWSGLNFANGNVTADSVEVSDRNPQLSKDAMPIPFLIFILSHPAEYPAWFIEILRTQGYVSWGDENAGDRVPPDLRKADFEAQRAMGGTNPYTNTDALRAISDQYSKAALRYAFSYPKRFFTKLKLGYEFFWQPMADYTSYYMSPLLIDADRRSIFGSPLLLNHPPVYERASPTQVAQRVDPPTLSLIPLDTFSIYMLTFGLPVLVALDLVAIWRRSRRWIGANLWSLIPIVAYGILVSTAVDLGENMRFRLTFEVVLFTVSIGTLQSLILGTHARVFTPNFRRDRTTLG